MSHKLCCSRKRGTDLSKLKFYKQGKVPISKAQTREMSCLCTLSLRFKTLLKNRCTGVVGEAIKLIHAESYELNLFTSS